MSFEMYSSYKDAGFVGLDQVPSHWDVLRFKQVFKEVNERSATGEEELLSVSEYYGVKPRSQKIDEGEHLSRAESLEGYKLCNEGDLVMNIMLAWKRGLGVTDYRGIVSPAYAVFRLVRDDLPYYYHYLLRSNEYIGYFKTFSSGVIDSRLRLYPEVFGRLTAIVPPVDEQTQIARFLDHETAKIDALIREQERLIELLQEKRQAVISHAVTKGLDPDVPMKDSGVEWLGEVPAHWECMSYRYATRILRGKFGHRPRNDPALYDGPYPFIQTGDVAQAEKHIHEFKQTLNEKGAAVSASFPAGTLVMAIAANIGDTAILGFEAYAPDSVVGFKPRSDVTLDFLKYSLDSSIQELEKTSTQSTQANLNIDRIGSVKAVFPPRQEQEEIVSRLDGLCERFSALEKEAVKSIAFMRERRSALISAAVTGKIDVRNWQPPQDESAFDEEVRQAGMEATA